MRERPGGGVCKSRTVTWAVGEEKRGGGGELVGLGGRVEGLLDG